MSKPASEYCVTCHLSVIDWLDAAAAAGDDDDDDKDEYEEVAEDDEDDDDDDDDDDEHEWEESDDIPTRCVAITSQFSHKPPMRVLSIHHNWYTSYTHIYSIIPIVYRVSIERMVGNQLYQ